MDYLPLELKQRVCSYLTPKDLKSLRLTSNHYAAAASRYLSPRIFLFNHPDSFQEVQEVIKHPDLRHSVTTLVVDTFCVPLFPEYERWARLFTDARPQSCQAATRAERAIRRARNREQWTKYQAFALAQRSTPSRKHMLDIVALAFRKCPRLINLIIKNYSSQENTGHKLSEAGKRMTGVGEIQSYRWKEDQARLRPLEKTHINRTMIATQSITNEANQQLVRLPFFAWCSLIIQNKTTQPLINTFASREEEKREVR